MPSGSRVSYQESEELARILGAALGRRALMPARRGWGATSRARTPLLPAAGRSPATPGDGGGSGCGTGDRRA